MVHHLTVEARRPPSWVSAVQPDEHARRLRDALGGLARDVSLRWADPSRLVLVLRYEPDGQLRRLGHQPAVDVVMEAVRQAGLYPTSARVSRVATHWAQGAIAGALTGLGLSQTLEEELQPAVTLAAIVLGAVAGALVRREVPVFRAALLPATGWRLIAVEPEVSAPRFRVGLA